MTASLLIEAIKFATTAPYFWSSMGFTTATAMFVGAAIYDGHLNQIRKALISVISYALLVIWVTFSRISNVLSIPGNELHPERPVGNLVALVCVTTFWILGVFLGVLVFHVRAKKGGTIHT